MPFDFFNPSYPAKYSLNMFKNKPSNAQLELLFNDDGSVTFTDGDYGKPVTWRLPAELDGKDVAWSIFDVVYLTTLRRCTSKGPHSEVHIWWLLASPSSFAAEGTSSDTCQACEVTSPWLLQIEVSSTMKDLWSRDDYLRLLASTTSPSRNLVPAVTGFGETFPFKFAAAASYHKVEACNSLAFNLDALSSGTSFSDFFSETGSSTFSSSLCLQIGDFWRFALTLHTRGRFWSHCKSPLLQFGASKSTNYPSRCNMQTDTMRIQSGHKEKPRRMQSPLLLLCGLHLQAPLADPKP